ncbi:NACHT domain-containing protein [Actinoplanes sp. L3-i22]|uniref:NACHT domain-containing protein n=1 Tax=Actinoplanes sp. L3-i22 TaxID=2836373 RepID=UPI001C84FEF7|nr:NACHT domain-containing protein [Actinoplanes sp. L3-i22]
MASAFALVGNLATGTVDINAVWIKWTVWGATLALLVAALAVERLNARACRAAPPGDAEVERITDEMALLLRMQWKEEETRRKVRAPVALPVSWHTVTDRRLVDHWENVRIQPLGSSAAPLCLDGGLDSILEVYRRIPSARLVILGRAGAGKTVLSVHLLLMLLDARTTGGPVPVIFHLRTWDPSTPLRTWLAERLAAGFPQLADPVPLLDRDRILPILDGFDEINPGLHEAAMRTFDLVPGPLVLTSRPEQFAEALRRTRPLGSAAVVHLDDLPLATVAQYLPRTTRQTASAWTSVFDRISADPARRGESNVGYALTTPLMVYLARTIYSGTRDPHELLDAARYPTAQAIEQHLLSAYIPAVYGADGPEGRWLTTMATLLERSGSRNLAWWRLRDSVPRAVRVGAFALAFTMVLGSLLFAVAADAGWDFLLAGILSIVVGPAFGLPRNGPAPVRGRLRYDSKMRDTVENIVACTATCTVCGIVFGGIGAWAAGGLLLGMVMSAPRSALIGATIAALGGAALGIRFGPAVFEAVLGMIAAGALVGGWIGGVGDIADATEARIDMASVAHPLESLRADRVNAVRRSLVVAATFDLLIFGLIGWDWQGLYLTGVLSALVAALGTAWVQWLILARVWLPLRGRLPWRLPAFLADAHDRGVLRQSGGFFQLRHELLQRHLAGGR